VINDAAGNIKAESDYYPWGGELEFVNNDTNDYKFTGKERDTETGLDYFGARYYSNGLGRWVSADWSATPIPVPYADFGDPQSLNLYGFVGGNPATRLDKDGHIALADDAVVAVAVVGTFAVIATSIYINQPGNAKNLANALDGAAGKISSWFHKNPSPPPSTATSGTNTQSPPTTATTLPAATTTQSVDQATKDKIKNNAGGTCEYCGKKTTTSADTARGRAPVADEGQTDHYKPKSKGGTDDEDNLAGRAGEGAEQDPKFCGL
jgi:RHS repeat-associated protein